MTNKSIYFHTSILFIFITISNNLTVQAAPKLQLNATTTKQPVIVNTEMSELVYDRNITLDSLPDQQKILWFPEDPLQKVLVIGFFVLFGLMLFLFVLYMTLACMSPEHLEKLDFNPSIHRDMDRGENICAILTYYCCCFCVCGLHTLMLSGAKKLANLCGVGTSTKSEA